MTGIISGAQQPAPGPGQPPPVPQAAPPAAAAPGSAPVEEPVTPEEQQMYEQVMIAVSKVIYEEGSSQAVVEAIEQNPQEPALVIATLVMSILVQLDEQSGSSMPEELFIPVADETAELIGELAEQEGLLSYDENMHMQVMQNLMRMLGEQFEVGPEEIQQMVGSVPEEQAQAMRMQQERAYGAVL